MPSGWKVNNTAAQVQLYAAQQDAVILFSMAPGASPAAAAEAFRQESQASILQSQAARINGLLAQQLVSDAALEQGNIRYALSFIQKDKYVYVFHTATPTRRCSTATFPCSSKPWPASTTRRIRRSSTPSRTS